jgi:hypothetical protein
MPPGGSCPLLGLSQRLSLVGQISISFLAELSMLGAVLALQILSGKRRSARTAGSAAIIAAVVRIFARGSV